MIAQKAGWDERDLADAVGVQVTTKGKDGATIRQKGHDPIHVDVLPGVQPLDPTGVGDAFRGGFLTGLAAGLDHRRCAGLGSTLAAYVIETVGTQEYSLTTSGFVQRIHEAYGADAATAIAPHPLPQTLTDPGQPSAMPLDPGPSRYAFDIERADAGEDLVGAGADLDPATILAAYRARGVPHGVGSARRGADGVVVAGSARRAPARGPQGQPLASALLRSAAGDGRPRRSMRSSAAVPTPAARAGGSPVR